MPDARPSDREDAWRLAREQAVPTEAGVGLMSLAAGIVAAGLQGASTTDALASGLAIALAGAAAGVVHARRRIHDLERRAVLHAAAYRSWQQLRRARGLGPLLRLLRERPLPGWVPPPPLAWLGYAAFVLGAVLGLAALPRLWPAVLEPPSSWFVFGFAFYTAAAVQTLLRCRVALPRIGASPKGS